MNPVFQPRLCGGFPYRCVRHPRGQTGGNPSRPPKIQSSHNRRNAIIGALGQRKSARRRGEQPAQKVGVWLLRPTTCLSLRTVTVGMIRTSQTPGVGEGEVGYEEMIVVPQNHNHQLQLFRVKLFKRGKSRLFYVVSQGTQNLLRPYLNSKLVTYPVIDFILTEVECHT